MISGKQKVETEFKKELFVGFTKVKVVAVNPSRDELCKMLERDRTIDDKDIVYMSQDADGNERLRLSFWMQDEVSKKYFVHSFNLTNKERTNKDGTKAQMVNSTCSTSWAPLEDGKVNEILLQDWFKSFLTKEKEVIGSKKYRRALAGEEELAVLLRAWLGRLNWNDPETEVMADTKKLFKENYKELRSLIDGDYDTPFVILLGVRTDENDPTKKYQQVWGKSFLPAGFMNYISKGNVFPSDYNKKVWTRFEAEVSGVDYGFEAYHELVPITEYVESRDIAGSKRTQAPTPSSSEY